MAFNILRDLQKLVTIKIKNETNVKIKRHKRYLKRHNLVLSKIRGKKVAMIFQEPFLALNPVLTVGDQIMESILLHERIEIANAIIRRETMGVDDIRAFTEQMLKLTDAEERKKAINNWVRNFGVSEIERSGH